MKSICNKVICTTIIAVLINLIVPQIVKPFATQKQISPPRCAANLNFKDQLVHMLVHHAQVPLSSSLIIAVIVAVSVLICLCLCK